MAKLLDENDVRNPLMTTILEHVEKGENKEVAVIMDSKSIGEQLKAIAWDIVPRVCSYLTKETHDKTPEVVDTAETVLIKLSEKCKAKEVMLVLLEQADSFKDDIKFTTLLPAIQKCLLMIPTKRGHSIAVALETLYAHIAALPLPEDQVLEGDQRKLYENDDDVRRINLLIKALTKFVKPLCENLSYHENEGHVKHKDRVEQRELIKYMLKFFTRPLGHVDMTYNGEKVKNEGRLNAEALMEIMPLLHADYVSLVRGLSDENFHIMQRKKDLIKKQEEQEARGDIPEDMDDYDVDEVYSELGFAVLIYLALGEGLGMENFPQVYTAKYLFEFILPFVKILLGASEQHSMITEKGVRLLSAALGRVSDESLSADILEWELLGEVVGLLINVMIHNQNKDIRTSAVQILPLWLKKFDQKGRHKSFYFLLVKEGHPGLVGYSIQMLKNEIDGALSMANPSEYFTGNHLEKLLNLVFLLPYGEKTDLLDQSDRIMAALNILRYIILRDKPSENNTGVWSYVTRVEETFLEPIRKGLDISRAHYELELTKLKDGTSEFLEKDKEKKGKKKGQPQVSLNVAGQNVPDLTPKQQQQVFQMALHTFDMIQSVLVRVNELIPQQRKAEAQN